ncbi:MAG: DNA adenine methylase [Bacteroidales bacterium]|jgi:DNA adenine methylase
MKPPLTYYGGKQKLAERIISMIPPHKTYCEPFFGGGAVFFAKPPAELEIINDSNGELINFYRILKTNYKKLAKEIKATLHSREEHENAEVVMKYPKLFSEVRRAWAIWTLANQSFASMLGGTWRCDLQKNSTASRLNNKRNNFTEEYAKRLEQTQIENCDALKVIKLWDSKDTFFYCDPPYFNADMGHYKGYTEQDFENLLKTLAKIKGKFILSSYPSELIEKYTKKYKWHTTKIEGIPVSVSLGKRKTKTEVLTGNYPIKIGFTK